MLLTLTFTQSAFAQDRITGKFCNPLVAIALGLALRNQKTIALEQQHAKGYASLPAITGKK
jgi:uncharacterized protein YfeS